MRRLYKLIALSLLSVTAGMYVGSGAKAWAAGTQDQSPKFTGTFLQLLPASHSQWTTTHWSTLFTHLKALGVEKLIIQWSVYNDSVAFPFEETLPVIGSELKTIMDLADRFKIPLYFGLNYDPAYWKRVEKDAPSVKFYLEKLGQKNTLLAKKLTSILHNHPSFGGWYITDEIDDVNWNNKDKRELIINYLKFLSHELHQLAPGKPIAISGFSNASLSPENLTQFWYEILTKTAIDDVLFQDGVGVNKLSIDKLPGYLDAVMQAAIFAHKNYHVVVEVFKQVSGDPIDNKPFKAIPASEERLQKQVKIASDYSPELFAFGIPEYMTPEMGDQARFLFEKFKIPIESK